MNEFDPRYRARNYFFQTRGSGGTAPTRVELARRNALEHRPHFGDPFGDRRR